MISTSAVMVFANRKFQLSDSENGNQENDYLQEN